MSPPRKIATTCSLVVWGAITSSITWDTVNMVVRRTHRVGATHANLSPHQGRGERIISGHSLSDIILGYLCCTYLASLEILSQHDSPAQEVKIEA